MIRSKHQPDLRGSHDHFICCAYICSGGRPPVDDHCYGCLFRVRSRARCGPVSGIPISGTPQTRVFAKEEDKQDVHSGYFPVPCFFK